MLNLMLWNGLDNLNIHCYHHSMSYRCQLGMMNIHLMMLLYHYILECNCNYEWMMNHLKRMNTEGMLVRCHWWSPEDRNNSPNMIHYMTMMSFVMRNQIVQLGIMNMIHCQLYPNISQLDIHYRFDYLLDHNNPPYIDRS